MSGSFNWSLETFGELYNTFKYEVDIDLDTLDFSNIKNDIIHVLTTPTPLEESRKKLGDGSKPVTLPNGDEVELNQAFLEVSTLLSNEFDLDQLNAAELLYYAGDITYKKGTSIGDSARLSYYLRANYILNILGYLISKKDWI